MLFPNATLIRMASLTFIITSILLTSLSSIQALGCESSCGNISLSYPFGSTWGCGSSAFQPYVNCSDGELQFYTPTGTYMVQSIDYTNNIIVVIDLSMSTCNSMQTSHAFGLPVSAPFSFASYDMIVLLGCSTTSSLYSKQSCDTSTNAQAVCNSIYQNCNAISQIGMVATSSNDNNTYTSSSSSSCCVYSSSLLQTAPYEVDLPLLQCTTYTSVYYMGSVQSPQSSWLYGIALQFNPSSSSQPSGGGQNPSCYVCQEAEESHGSILSPPAIGFAGLLVVVVASIISSLTSLSPAP